MNGLQVPDGGYTACAFYYIMSEKSKHLTRLENIYARLHPEENNPPKLKNDIQSRMDKIITLIYIQSLIANIQESIKIIPTKIDIDFDKDVDFDYWSNIYIWGDNYGDKNEKALSLSEVEGICPNDESINSTYANAIAGYFPTIPDTETQADAHFRDNVRSALMLFSGPFFNSLYLDHAIRNAIRELCRVLKELQEGLNYDYPPIAYQSLYNQLYIKYSFANIDDYDKEYKLHKKHRDEITSEWLNDYIGKEVNKLAQSKFMKAIMEDLTYAESQKATIPYPIDGLPKKDQQKFYAALSRLCTFTDGLFDFTQNDILAGRTIYKFRDSFKNEEYNDFFQFRLLVTKISQDLEPLLNDRTTTSANITKKKVQPIADHCFMTFQCSAGVSDFHIAALQQDLVKQKWISKDTNPDDFNLLFSGKSCVCKIIWTGGGKGNLRELFHIMREQQLITIPGNNGLEKVLESHFVDKNGNYLSGLNSSKPSKKTLPIIAECIRILQQSIDFND